MAVAVVVVAAIAYAHIPGSSGVITACVNRATGAVRFVDIDRGQRCRGDERRVRFNQRGRRGPVGPRGPAGLPGSMGARGRDAGTIVDGGGACGKIQSAINALPPGGGAVLVRPGVYTCAASIVINRNNVALRGSGPATVLRLGGHVNRPVIVLGQTAVVPTLTRHDLAVSDLSIDGNRGQQDFECSSGPCTSTDVLRNNALSLRKVTDVVVERVAVVNAKSGGLVPELGSRRLAVSDLTVSGSQFDGIAGYQTEDSVFTRLYLHDNDGAGMSFDIDFNRNAISDSVLEGNGDVGIFMRDSSDNLFSGLLIRESGNFGLFLAQVGTDTTKPAAGNTFTGSVVAGSGQNPSKGGHGMRVNDASCTNNLVVSTQFVGNRDGGISEASPGLVQTSAVITR